MNILETDAGADTHDPDNVFEYVYVTPSILHNTGPVHYVGGNTGSGYALRNNRTGIVYFLSAFLIPETHTVTDLKEYHEKFHHVSNKKRAREEQEEDGDDNDWNVTSLTTDDTKTAQMLLQFNPEKTFLYLVPNWSGFGLRKRLSEFSFENMNYLSCKHFELFRMYPTPMDYSIPRFCSGRVLMYKLPESSNKFEKLKEPDLTSALSHRGDEGFNLFLTIVNSEKEQVYTDFFVRFPFIEDCSLQEQDIVRVFSAFCPDIVDVKTVTIPVADFLHAGQDNSIHYSKMAYFAETKYPTLWEEMWKPHFDSIPSPMLFELCNCSERNPTVTRIRVPRMSSKEATSVLYNVLLYDNFTMKHWIVVSTRCNTLLRGVRRTPVRNRRPSAAWMESLARRKSFGEPDVAFFKKIFWGYNNMMEECMSESSIMSIWAKETFEKIQQRFHFKSVEESIYYSYKIGSLFFSNMCYSMLPSRVDWEKAGSWGDISKNFPHMAFSLVDFTKVRKFVLEDIPDIVDKILLPPEYVRFSSQATIVGDRLFFWSSLAPHLGLKDSKSTYAHTTLLKNISAFESVMKTVPVIDTDSKIAYAKWIQQWMCRIGKVWCILYGRQCDRIDYGILKFASFPSDDSVVKSSKFTFQCPFLSYVKQKILLRGVPFDAFSRLASKNTQCYTLPAQWPECIKDEEPETAAMTATATEKSFVPTLPVFTDSSIAAMDEGKCTMEKIRVSVKVDTTFTFGWIETSEIMAPEIEPESSMAPSIDWMNQMNSLNMFSGVAAFRTTVNELKTLAVFVD